MQSAEFIRACSEISQNLLSIQTPTRNQVKTQIKKVCTKYSLERIPRNHEILATVSGSNYTQLKKILLKKPVKTASGVAVIALMPMPYACPHGRCTYCPGGIESNSPNSYTGNEPSTINAIENNYDASKQILSKIEKLVAYGHDPTKMELVIVGGTFLFMPKDYQQNFIKSCYDALNGFASETLDDAKTANETAQIRSVGFTVETKPDYCKREHVDMMLQYGITRVEIGVQSLQERVYKIVNRGHTYDDVLESFQVSKDAGYKIVAHMMPGLPTVTPEQDISDFARLFEDQALRPDMLKIYPSLVLQGTPLYGQYVDGRYTPYSDEDMIRVLMEVKKKIPRWVRIMRVQREISPSEIIAGPRSGNLRQIVHERLRKEGTPCKCIRCREIGTAVQSQSEVRLNRVDYDSSGGSEVFLSYDDADDRIYGFLRLRAPNKPHRTEIHDGACIVRELHVYGRPQKIGEREDGQVQHSGLGKGLMVEAERIAIEEFDAKKILVISAVGTREYYRKIGYVLDGPYMAKSLVS